jgi:hypothetical protein
MDDRDLLVAATSDEPGEPLQIEGCPELSGGGTEADDSGSTIKFSDAIPGHPDVSVLPGHLARGRQGEVQRPETDLIRLQDNWNRVSFTRRCQ